MNEYTKINWQDGTVLQPAKVTIDGTDYDVTPAVESGTTPVNATNLNKMDTALKQAHDSARSMEINKIDKATIELLTVDSTAPEHCSEGDMYYNTTTNYIYTATGTDTWGSTGALPSSKYLYVDLSNSKLYYYDGTTFTSYGGGASNDVIISDTQPTEEDNKIWVNTGEVQNIGSELPLVYPIGSIYMSVNNTNPTLLFGFGAWEQLKDRFLLGAGDTYTAGNTGGEATHTLTTSEIPKHEHNITWANGEYGITNQGKIGTGDATWNYLKMQDISSGTSLKAAQQSTGGEEHNNMPPYLVVYMWKRVA